MRDVAGFARDLLAATYPERIAGLVVLSNALQLRLLSPRLPLAFCQRVKPFGIAFIRAKQAPTFVIPKRVACIGPRLTP